MKMILKYSELDVIHMDIDLFPEGIQVLEANVINKEKIPSGLKPAFDKEEWIQDINYFLEEWLMARSIPDYRQNIDEFVLSLHHLPRHLFGRMNGYQHTAAVLSYFSSYFDQYYITPEKEELICFANIDDRFKNLYALKPANSQYIKFLKGLQQDKNANRNFHEIQEDINKFLKGRVDKRYNYKGCFPTVSFTIPSMAPSWWIKKDGKMILMQQCLYSHDKKRAEVFVNTAETVGIPGKRFFDGKYLYSDYTYLNGSDTTWLGEYIPYLCAEKTVREQIEMIGNKEFEYKALDRLFEMDQQMRQKGFEIALTELGVMRKEKISQPVILF